MSRRFELNDVGNAQRLAHYCGHDFRYVPAWGRYLVWDGTRWVDDTRGTRIQALAKVVILKIKEEAKQSKEARREVLYKWAHASAARPRIEAMIALVVSEPNICVAHDLLDRNVWLFNCKNGTLDLRTGKFRRHERRDMLMKISPIKFDPKERAPGWKKFLEKVLPDPDVCSFMQRFAGYALTGDVGERMFVVLHGGGRNGKSVFLRILQKMLGPYAASAAPGLLMAKDNEAHPTEVADLFGVRLAVASEVRKGRTFDEEAVKRLTGNDTLKARKMKEDFWEFDPTFKLLIAANHKPRVRDASDSFWDRIALVLFGVRISDKDVDRDLLTKLTKELSGVLNWAVEGCRAWQKRGMRSPSAVKDATQEYRESEDKVGRFINERCVFGPLCEATNEDFSKAVRRWCEASNVFIFNDKDLHERFLDKGCERRVNMGSRKARGWRGVGLNTSTKSQGDNGDVGDGKRGIAARMGGLVVVKGGKASTAAKGEVPSPTSPTSPSKVPFSRNKPRNPSRDGTDDFAPFDFDPRKD